MSRRVLGIGGPTAGGKTALAVEVAQRLGGELLNADSRQVMRRLHEGTAAPTAAELRGVRCHLLGLTEPGETLSPPEWRELALGVLGDLDARGVPAVVVGGTGQYLRALREGWTFRGAAPDPAVRAQLAAAAASPVGLAALADEVRARDPVGALTVDLENPRRVVRAVETLRAGVSLAGSRGRAGGVDIDMVVVEPEPGLQRSAVAARLSRMFDASALLDEVTAELARGTSPAALRRAGIGYSEALDVLAGTTSREQGRATAEQRTLRYAKAQRTWFRAEPARLRVRRTAADTVAMLADAVLGGPAGD